MEPENWNEAQYGYMDSMSLDGWIWEFIRRNEAYKSAYSEVDGIFKKYEKGILYGTIPEEESTRVYEIWWNIEKAYSIPIVYIDSENIKDKVFRLGIPNPESRYNTILESQKPLIIKTDPVISFRDRDLERRLNVFWLQKEYRTMIEQQWQGDKKLALMSVIRDLFNPGKITNKKGNTIYLWILDTGRSADIRKEINKAIIKVRTPKTKKIKSREHVPQVKNQVYWKPYLQVFDMKKAGLGNDEIARRIFSSLSNNYPDYQGTRQVRRYYQSANQLIQKGFKRYL